MLREDRYAAIVLKKQPYKEGDEIITIYTKEAGKLRVLAKSIKRHNAKLQQRLQTLFLLNLSLSSGKLPKVVFAETVKAFPNIRENLDVVKRAYYALELVLKFTPDAQPNPGLFDLLVKFFSFLDSSTEKDSLNSALAKFKLNILETLGLGLSWPAPDGSLFFSLFSGGFVKEKGADGLPVNAQLYDGFTSLRRTDFTSLPKLKNIDEINSLLSKFIEHQLERSLKSERYF